jgi:putative ABC transport system permease protein
MSVDGRVLAFSIAVSLLTGLLFGLLPALSASRVNVVTLLKQGGSKGAAGSSNRLRHALIVAEVALSVVLLAGAGLLVRSYLKLQSEGPGYSSTTVTMQLYSGDASPERRVQYHEYLRQAIARTAALPGVTAVGIVNDLPLSEADSMTFLHIDGYANEANQLVNSYTASAGYFQAMEIRLLAGRFFDDRDAWGQTRTAIVNRAFAKKYFNGADPIGRQICLCVAPYNNPTTIVGVIADVKHMAVDEVPRTEVYTPLWQGVNGNATLAVRAAGPVAPLATGLRRIAQALAPNAPPFDVRTMDQLISQSVARRRFQTSLLTIFAGIALMLALVGIYGLMTYSVKQRTPELGIRMTLGASRAKILAMVLGQGVTLTAMGIVLGIAGALALTRVLAASLYGVQPTDPITFYGVPVLILLVSAAACLIPAWKATKIDPAIALRYE